MSRPIIHVEALTKKYRLGVVGATTLREDLARLWGRRRIDGSAPDDPGEFWALRDLSFAIAPGEVVGVIGRNGAGKSTLLKILSRITEPTSGRATLRGRVASLLEVGTGFHLDLTGRENVFLNGAILGMKRAEIARRFDEIVAFAEVEKFIDTPVKHYSSGMRVRLAFAVAAHLDSEIMIVDEVLAVGDAAFQSKCLGRMSSVARAGRTVLFVSHNMQSVSTLTSRCIVLEGGKCVLDDEPTKAIQTYLRLNRSTEAIFSAPPKPDAPSITHVSLTTSEPGSIHRCGAPLVITVRVHAPAPLPEAQVSVQIVNEQDVPIVHLPFFDRGQGILNAAGECTLECRVPSPRLYLGSYFLRVHLASTRGHQHFQTVEGICPFEVVMHGMDRPWPWRPGECAYVEDGVWTTRLTPAAPRP
ncbi:MAG TPA: ABC transporter ATP-binding protein [Opitutaceae bacterium]|nr:ABC transporter ATP-binding protein [Opitutaceae bacterium]